MERKGNTRVGNPRRRRKPGKRRRGGGKMSGIGSAGRGSRRRAHPARKVEVDRQRGRGGSLGFLRNGKRRIERIELRLVRVMVDVKREDLGMVMRIGTIDIVLDPVMRPGRTDIDHDPTMRGVNDTAQQTGTIGKIVNLLDRGSIEKKRLDEDHVTIAIHHLDQNRVNLLGMVNPTQDLGRGRWMNAIDVQ